MAEGWLWDSIFMVTARPPPMSTTPAFSSPGLTMTRGPVLGKRRSSALECL